MQNIDLIIKGGFVLQDDNDDHWTPRSIAVHHGLIIAIDDPDRIEMEYLPEVLLSAENKLVAPGFINAHTHVSMAFYKGLADDLPLLEWLNNHIWPMENKLTSREFVRDAALFGCADMIKNGITMINEMYFLGMDAAVSAKKIGIRAVMGEGILDIPIAGYQNADDIIAYTREMYEQFRHEELIDVFLAPHAIYTCGRSTLEKIIKLATEMNMPIHIHVSETEKEVRDCLQEHGVRPCEYLDRIELFSVPTIIAHGIWIDENEQEILAEKNISVAINTSSNLKLASGFAPIKDYLAKRVNLCLGTDGVASNNNLSMLGEMNLTAKLHKALNNDPTLLPAWQVFRMANMNGARALGKESQLGKLAPGWKADIITVAINEINCQPIYDPFSHLVYTIIPEQIKEVIVNGKIIMKDRILLTVDEEELLDKALFYSKLINNLKI
ncbi:MAG: amidohydrolase family protein [Candidatus Cloacimonetes bacterium]|nr:amidohydrolase family protein [Candidatus Cloacimonadota bacterium]